MSFLARARTRLRRVGIAIERTYLFKRSAATVTRGELYDDLDLRIGLVPPADIDSLCALGADNRETWKLRLERGDECCGAWIGDDLVHYSWIQLEGKHAITSAAIEIPLRTGEFWIYNCRTSETHRGRRIYPRTLERIVLDRFAAGSTTAWIYTTENNIASQRGVERAGFVRVQALRALRLGQYYRALTPKTTLSRLEQAPA